MKKFYNIDTKRSIHFTRTSIFLLRSFSSQFYSQSFFLTYFSYPPKWNRNKNRPPASEICCIFWNGVLMAYKWHRYKNRNGFWHLTPSPFNLFVISVSPHSPSNASYLYHLIFKFLSMFLFKFTLVLIKIYLGLLYKLNTYFHKHIYLNSFSFFLVLPFPSNTLYCACTISFNIWSMCLNEKN